MPVSLRLQFLDTGDLVTGRTIVTRDFRLDDDHRGDFIRNTKIWGLPKAWYPLGTFGFPVRDTRMSQLVLNRIFHHFSHKLRYRIAMPSERTTEIPLVEEHRIRDIF